MSGAKAKKASKKAPKLTPKQERFAQLVASGETGAGAYRKTYAVRKGTKPETVHQSACRLLADPNVSARVEELRKPVIRKAQVTLEGHLDDLKRLREEARKKGQLSAAISAEVARGKASGVHVEHHRHSGAIGTYDLTQLTNEQLDALEQILGPLAHAGGDPGGEGAEGG